MPRIASSINFGMPQGVGEAVAGEAANVVASRLSKLRTMVSAGLAVLVAGAMSAHAQTPPSAAVAPLQVPPTQRVIPPEQPQVLPPAAAPEAPPPAPEGGPVRVDAVRLEGVTVYDEAALQALYGRVAGPAVQRVALDDIVRQLQKRYRDDGYILTVVHGQFERKDNRIVFVIRAVEGYISDIKLDGDIGPAGKLVYDMLQHLTHKRPLNNADLERYLLLANDIPGVKVKAVLRRQTDPGAVELVAQMARKAVSGSVTYDNRGSEETGPNELLVSGATNSFTNFGEKLEAMLFSTLNREEIFGQVNGDMFLTDEGLHLHTFFGDGNEKPGGLLKGTGYVGDLSIGGGDLSYPIFRSRRFNWSTE